MQALVAGRLAGTVFALHFHTLGFLLMTVGIGVDTMLGTRPNVSSLAFLVAAVMLFPSLRRVYAEGRLRTIGKQVVLLLAYGLVVLIGNARARDHHQSGGLAGPTGIPRPPPQNSAAVERLSEWC